MPKIEKTTLRFLFAVVILFCGSTTCTTTVESAATAPSSSPSSVARTSTPWTEQTASPSSSVDTMNNNMVSAAPSSSDAAAVSDIRIVFSDVDGTLVHYPTTTTIRGDRSDDGNDDDDQTNHRTNRILLRLPPSATGMQAIVSSQTLALCQTLRRCAATSSSESSDGRIKLVLVSGMRTATLLKRLPFLPKADAYCSEAGGRIFMLEETKTHPNNNRNHRKPFSRTVMPEPYGGADPEKGDLEPFEIVEDMEWRRRMEDPLVAAGRDGYQNDVNGNAVVPIQDREGKLWEYARQLMAKGFVVDSHGYATCFRVNFRQQTNMTTKDDFEALLRGDILPCPPELATSTNLGCIDYYPAASGKKHCCQYLAKKLLVGEMNKSDDDDDDATTSSSSLLSRHCVCLCDDDNDLEMALACQHAYIPGVSSTSMATIISQNPHHFTQTGNAGDHDDDDGIMAGVLATEKALSLVLQKVKNVV